MDSQVIKEERVSGSLAALRLRPFLFPAVRPSELARAAGVTRQYVNDVLTGRRPPSARIIKAAAELGLPVVLIFGDQAIEAGAASGDER